MKTKSKGIMPSAKAAVFQRKFRPKVELDKKKNYHRPSEKYRLE